ncbi:MAG TPA: PilZ domain-containing protein [Candidatus Acidoferrales bacterium]
MKVLSKKDYSQVPADPVEKRRCPRYPFSSAVEATDIRGNTRITGRISDISGSGCYMDTISPFIAATTVTLTITRGNESFKTHAKVVYSQSGMGMGLLFTTAEAEELRMLGMWLGELSGGEQDQKTAPNGQLQSDTPKSTGYELRDILEELIILLRRKNVLIDSEAEALLRKLSKWQNEPKAFL